VVYREVCTEGSETAKSGTDEQELNMRHNRTDEVAQHTDVQAQEVKYLLCRFSRHRRKEKALTGGGLGIDPPAGWQVRFLCAKKSAEVILVLS